MAKPRKTVRTDRAREAFLATFAATCNVSEACRAAKISRSSAYEWRNDDPAFAQAWDDAEEEAVDALELAARERAIDGSDRMMEILLKAHRPEKYVERLRSEISGPGGGPVKIDMKNLTDEQLAALEALNASQAQP